VCGQAGGLSVVLGLITGAGTRAGEDGPGAGSGHGGGVGVEVLLQALRLANELLPPVPASEDLVALVAAVGGGPDAGADVFGRDAAAAACGGEEKGLGGWQGALVGDCGGGLLPVLVDISVTVVNDAVRFVCACGFSCVCVCSRARTCVCMRECVRVRFVCACGVCVRVCGVCAYVPLVHVPLFLPVVPACRPGPTRAGVCGVCLPAQNSLNCPKQTRLPKTDSIAQNRLDCPKQTLLPTRDSFAHKRGARLPALLGCRR
jgi:hypothetical protein